MSGVADGKQKNALKRAGDREPNRERFDRMQDTIHHAVRAHRGRYIRYSAGREALGEQGVGFQQRAVGVGDLVGFAVGEVERVELYPPAILEPIAELPIEQSGRRRAERIVLGQWSRTEVAEAQGAEPPGLLAQYNAGGSNDVGRAGNEVAGRVADLHLRKTGERIVNIGLLVVEADKRGVRQREVAVEREPGERPIAVGE